MTASHTNLEISCYYWFIIDVNSVRVYCCTLWFWVTVPTFRSTLQLRVPFAGSFYVFSFFGNAIQLFSSAPIWIALKNTKFWDITPHGPLNVGQRFGAILHIQGLRISRTRQQRESRRQAERILPQLHISNLIWPWPECAPYGGSDVLDTELGRKMPDPILSGLPKCNSTVYYCRRDPSRWPRGSLYPQKMALTLPTSGGRSVGIVLSRTQATEFFFIII
jgi:hypothetical protein